jgi:hypothetical protein
MENLLDPSASVAMHGHLADCTTCRAKLNATRELHDRLSRLGEVPISHRSLDGAVMDQILSEQVNLTRRLTIKRRLQLFTVGSLAATLLISVTWAALN